MKQESKIKENQRIFDAKIRCHRKVVYNYSGEPLTKEEEEDLLSLGLNFSAASTVFPAVKFMRSTENFCQDLEKEGHKESKEKVQKIRNIMVNQLRKGCWLG